MVFAEVAGSSPTGVSSSPTGVKIFSSDSLNPFMAHCLSVYTKHTRVHFCMHTRTHARTHREDALAYTSTHTVTPRHIAQTRYQITALSVDRSSVIDNAISYDVIKPNHVNIIGSQGSEWTPVVLSTCVHACGRACGRVCACMRACSNQSTATSAVVNRERN